MLARDFLWSTVLKKATNDKLFYGDIAGAASVRFSETAFPAKHFPTMCKYASTQLTVS